MPTNPDELFQEAACFNCNSNASLADLLKLALLDRISESGGGGGTPSAPLNSVQFNNAGAFGGSADLTFDDATNVLALAGSETIAVGANASALSISGYSLTGANAQSMIDLSGTWNTAGNPVGILLSITDTASGGTANFLQFLGGAGGATSMFSVRKNGYVTSAIGYAVGTAADISNVSGGDGLRFSTGFTARWDITAAGHILAFADNAYDIGASGATRPRNLFLAGGITTGATTLHSTSAALTDNAGGGAGTLTNAPSAGDPTKWIAIDDNGTPRYIPTWT